MRSARWILTLLLAAHGWTATLCCCVDHAAAKKATHSCCSASQAGSEPKTQGDASMASLARDCRCHKAQRVEAAPTAVSHGELQPVAGPSAAPPRLITRTAAQKKSAHLKEAASGALLALRPTPAKLSRYLI